MSAAILTFSHADKLQSTIMSVFNGRPLCRPTEYSDLGGNVTPHLFA
jgi:hypothetical protein